MCAISDNNIHIMSSQAVITMSESVALNYKRIKRKNAIIAGGVLGVNYPLNSEHKERATKERTLGV